jgi:NADH:ubiquinone oxidoreductase subunit 4 (subunit M)
MVPKPQHPLPDRSGWRFRCHDRTDLHCHFCRDICLLGSGELHKEFFISLILLSTGVFGFFISLDLFTLFLFYEVAVIPMYLLIGIWGSGPREYSAMKLTLMLMGGSALILVGLLGLYFNSNPSGGQLTFSLLAISKVHIPIEVQKFFFPLPFRWIRCAWSLVSIPHMVS